MLVSHRLQMPSKLRNPLLDNPNAFGQLRFGLKLPSQPRGDCCPMVSIRRRQTPIDFARAERGP